MNNLKTTHNNFIYVVGCPRSGTYLLSTLLYKHFSISLPLETHFIHIFDRYIGLWGDLSKRKNRQLLLNDIYDFLEIWMKLGHQDMDFDKAVPYSLIATRERQDEIIDNSNSYPELINNLFRIYAELHNTDIWGDKTVLFQHVPLNQLDQTVPSAKIIHIIRDGRDVSMSWQKTWFGPKSLSEGAGLWAKHVSLKRLWGVNHPGKYLEVRYEDLLEDEHAIMEKIAAFLNVSHIDMTEQSYSSGMAQALEGPGTHELLSRPIDKSNQNKWKKIMGSSDRKLFEHIAGPELSAFGYEAEYAELPILPLIKIKLRIIVGWFKAIFSMNFWKRKIKMLLPLILYVSRRLHIPLLKILFK